MRAVIALLALCLQVQAATYYIRTAGNDSCNGTSATLGSSGACAWKTITHALTAGALTTNDQVWVGGGTYRESNVTNGYSGYTITGDNDGTQTGDVGPVTWTAYLTSDTSAPAATTLFKINGKTGVTVDGLILIGGNFATATLDFGFQLATLNNIVIRHCVITAAAGTITNNLVVGSFANGGHAITIDKCIFYSAGDKAILWNMYKNAAADYNVGIVVSNCLFIGGGNGAALGITGLANGGNTFLGGGVTVINCSFPNGASQSDVMGVTNSSSTFPLTITNCNFDMHIRTTPVLVSGSVGMIVENYNVFDAMTTTNTNVTAGANSLIAPNLSTRLNLGAHMLWPLIARCWSPYAPLVGSPLLGAGTATGAPATDITGATRPNPPSIGAFELSGGCPMLVGGGGQ